MERTSPQAKAVEAISTTVPMDITEILAISALEKARHGETRSPDLVSRGRTPDSEEQSEEMNGMEVTMLQVKVLTLNRGTLGQLESVKTWSDSCVKGWVNLNGEVVLIVTGGTDGDQLQKVRWMDLWDRVASAYHASPMEKIREVINEYYHKYPQIFV